MVNKGLDIALFVYIQLWITKDSHSLDPFCPDGYKDKAVYICTDHSRSKTREIFIDTASVPKFQQTFCECIITPFQPKSSMYIYLSNMIGHGVEMKINNMVLQKRFDHIMAFISGGTTLYFSTAENYSRGACVKVKAWTSNFNITCSHPTPLVTDTTPSATSRATTTDISDDSKATSLTKASTKDLTGHVIVKTSTTETIQKSNITSVPTDASYKGNIRVAVIVVPAVIGVLLIALVLILVYVRRRRFATDTKNHEQGPCRSSSEQSQGQQNNPENEEGTLDIPVNAYERLNMYANDTMAGEMYQQLHADETEENIEMYDIVTDSRNQNRNITKQVKQEGQLNGEANRQGNNSNGEDTEIAANAYERLHMYASDNLAGEMYEQLDAHQDVSGNKDIPVKNSYHGTKQKK